MGARKRPVVANGALPGRGQKAIGGYLMPGDDLVVIVLYVLAVLMIGTSMALSGYVMWKLIKNWPRG